MVKAWILNILEKCASEYISKILKKAKTEGYLSVWIEIKKQIKKGILIMKNFKFNLQNHSDETAAVETAVTDVATAATETVESAVETATETVTTAVTAAATSTADVVTSTVSTVTSEASNSISEKIAALAKEITTTHSLFVKIRNTVEIGVLSALLAKAAKAISDKTSN
jgi:hypothetical protein